jgi:hypothetical protein
MMEVPKEARNGGLNPKAGFANSYDANSCTTGIYHRLTSHSARPFDSPQVSLEFVDGCRLTIHHSILLRCAEVSRRIDSSPETIKTILRRFSSTAGHALVEHLYTSSYGLLKRAPSPSVDLELSELTAKFEIYALARTLELDGLEREVTNDIERTTQHLDIFTVIDIVKDAYPTHIGNDMWFPQWINEVTKRAFKHPEKLMSIAARPDFRDDASVAKFLFKSMLESYVDELKSSIVHDGASISTDVVAAEADKSPTSDSSFVDIGGSEVRDAFQGAAEAIPEPAPEPAPELHAVPSPEAEPALEPTAELAEPGPLKSEDDPWGRWPSASKKDKKKKKDKMKASTGPYPL